MTPIRDWVQRHLSNPQVVSLMLLLLVLLALVTFFSSVFAPVFTAVVIAYLLEGAVGALERRGLARVWAAAVVWLVFVVTMVVVLSTLLPMLIRQVTQVVTEIPKIVVNLQQWMLTLPERYPNVFSARQMEELAGGLNINVTDLRNEVLARTRLLGAGIFFVVIYGILVPLMVFFMLKDKAAIIAWGRSFLPSDITLIGNVWREVDGEIANYVRGKAVEITIVWVVTYLTFAALGLNYAVLLGALTGFSVLVPWVGATVVTIPVAGVAYAQFGIGPEFASVLIAYGVIQALDGNVLVPIIFSETNNLHPVAIIVAVLFFGTVWGFWGVFFAIPLATLVAAVIRAWPRAGREVSDLPPPNSGAAGAAVRES